MPKEVTHKIYMPLKMSMLQLIRKIKIQEKSLENLKNEFEQKTKFLEQNSRIKVCSGMVMLSG